MLSVGGRDGLSQCSPTNERGESGLRMCWCYAVALLPLGARLCDPVSETYGMDCQGATLSLFVSILPTCVAPETSLRGSGRQEIRRREAKHSE